MKRILVIAILLSLMIGSVGSFAVAQEGDPILIGLQGPMTGDYAYEGQGF